MSPLLRSGLFAAAFWLLFLLAVPAAHAGDAKETKLEVLLVWGTNDEKSPDPEHKPLDPKLASKLKMFKWKNYFLVCDKTVAIPFQGNKKVKLSDRAEVEIKDKENSKFEISLYGKGKLVQTTTKAVPKGDVLTIAGDDKNDCAWFILIRQK
jgi:hypothetical protein